MQLQINLDIEGYEHLKDISHYNYNLYKIKFAPYSCWTGNNDILLEECHEEENYFSLALGHFNEQGKFTEMIIWEAENGIESLIH